MQLAVECWIAHMLTGPMWVSDRLCAALCPKLASSESNIG